MSYKFDTPYNDFYVSEYFKDGKRTVFGKASFTALSLLQVIGDNTVDIKEKIKDESLLKELRENDFYKMLRDILAVKDTMTKYLLLYSLLYLINEDSQNKVERFIDLNELNVEKMGRLRSDGRLEMKSIYTTLRNKVGHITKSEDINMVAKDMNRTMGRLIRLVKIAIEQTHL